MRATLLTTLVLFTATILFGQTPSKTTQILRTVTEINTDGSLTTKLLSNEQFLDKNSGQTGQLTGYFKNGQLVKMQVRMSWPGCVANDKYYLQNNELIMFYRQERAFLYNEATKAYDVTHQQTSMEGRYYYDAGAMLKNDFTGDPKCAPKPSEQQAAEMAATCKKYAALLKK